MMISLRRAAAALLLGLAAASPAVAAEQKLRFAVGPFLPTASDTRKSYEPFFKHVAQSLGADYDLAVTVDWAGIAVALANDQVDLAWMGPWGYVLAAENGQARAIATVKYDGKPTYHAIVVGRPELDIKRWPDDAKGLRISFADVGSTSGWLIPTWWLKSRGLDPKAFFQYREGAAHPANEVAVASGQVDLATDYDRNRIAMIERGALAPDATKIVWTSDPLPNDAIAVRKGFDPALEKKVQALLTAMTEQQAKDILPAHYTGFVPATHDTYKQIEDAGVLVGRIKRGS